MGKYVNPVVAGERVSLITKNVKNNFKLVISHIFIFSYISRVEKYNPLAAEGPSSPKPGQNFKLIQILFKL
jgi:hypothetical protein